MTNSLNKTVKQLIEEYKNRQQNPRHLFISFEKPCHTDGYSNIVNLARDGVKVGILTRDDEMYEYEFDSGFDDGDIIRWTHNCFRGRIVEFSYDIE